MATSPRTAPAVFTIPAGLPFLPTLADALLVGGLIPLERHDPSALADVTVLLPTRRAVRAFHDVLLDRLGGQAAIMPRVRPIGDVDDDEHLLDRPDGDPALLPEAVSPLDRRLALTRLTLHWAQTVRREILGLSEADELAIPASAADALHLAAHLARLIDDMETAGVPWDAIRGLAPENHAAHFQITLDFLTIVSERWPAHLDEIGRADPTVRRDRLIRAEAQRIATGQAVGPVIAAGSTGSMPATAELLRAIAHAPAGAVVLPGLDQRLDTRGWNAVDTAEGAGTAVYGHPQFGLKRLIGEIGIAREDVTPLGRTGAGAAARAEILSQAMRPSETSDAWGAGLAADTVRAGLDGVALAVCRNEQEEALVIAVAMREAIEVPAARIALVTPDRDLARRVATELGRWGLRVDDSAGSSLDREPAGVLCRLIAECAEVGDAVGLLALLKHPLANFGMPVRDRRRAARALELGLLRGARFAGSVADLPALVRSARAAAVSGGTKKQGGSGRRPRLDDEHWDLAATLSQRIASAFAPLSVLQEAGTVSVSEVARALTETLRAAATTDLGTEEVLWLASGGEDLARLLTELMNGHQSAILTIGAVGFSRFVGALLADVDIQRDPGADPRLAIWGTLEARLQTVDLIILGGLEEGVWPTVARTDPWLSRIMRAEIGLAPPERRLGLAAHDFVHGLANPRVLCTRAGKRGGAPTVESRWLQRLRAVTGEIGLQPAIKAGDRLVALARMVDRAEEGVETVRQPAPTPPLLARPARLTVTEIETLIRDPYAIYARRVLRLNPLDPIGAVRDRQLRGILFHDILGQFTQAWRQPFDQDAQARLMANAEEVLAEVADSPELLAIWSNRFAAIAAWFIGWEADRDARVERRFAETDGSLRVDAATNPVELTGRADRIDLMADGTVAIYDFKTGTPRTANQVYAGLAPQMTLEAAMVREGAFGESLKGRSVSELAWLAIGQVGRDDPRQSAVAKGKTADELAEKALRLFKELVESYANPEHGYRSRARPFNEYGRFTGDYDHLARVQEWSLQESEDDYK